MADPSQCQALVKVDNKVSRALQSGKGIKLSSAELELLASIGVVGVIADAKARALEEEARSRQKRGGSTEGVRGDLTSLVPAAAKPSATNGTSIGPMAPPEDSSGRLRAQRLFVRQ
jgi:hypothetical protein